MLRRAAKSLLPRLPALASEIEGTQAARPACTRQLTSTTAAQGIHIEEEVYNRQRQLIILGNRVPTLAMDSWVAPNAVLVGDVDLYDGVSVWYGCVLRGDLNKIKVAAGSTVGDRTVIHAARTSPTGLPAATSIGRNVTIGQACLLRSVNVADDCIVGDKCVLLEGSMVETQSVLAPGTVLPPGRRVPSGQLWAGNPARFVRDLTKDEKAAIPAVAALALPAAEQHSVEFTPESFAYREAEELLTVLKPESALVRGADLAGIAEAAAVVEEYEDDKPHTY